VLAGGRFPTEAISNIGVTRSGLVDLDRLRVMLADLPPALVSIMLANNETGAVQPVAEAGEIVHSAGGLLHVDAIQAFGKVPFDINALNADLLTLSAHKIGGPKAAGRPGSGRGIAGTGTTIARRRSGAGPPRGHGERRRNCRVGAAVSAALSTVDRDAIRLEGLRNHLENGLRQTPDMIVFSDDVTRLPKHHAVHGSRPEGGNRGDRLRPRGGSRSRRVLLALRGRCSIPCAAGHGIRPQTRAGSGAAQSGLVHIRSGH